MSVDEGREAETPPETEDETVQEGPQPYFDISRLKATFDQFRPPPDAERPWYLRTWVIIVAVVLTVVVIKKPWFLRWWGILIWIVVAVGIIRAIFAPATGG